MSGKRAKCLCLIVPSVFCLNNTTAISAGACQWILISDETSVALRVIGSAGSRRNPINATQVFLSAGQGFGPHSNKVPVNFVLVVFAQNICWMWRTWLC